MMSWWPKPTNFNVSQMRSIVASRYTCAFSSLFVSVTYILFGKWGGKSWVGIVGGGRRLTRVQFILNMLHWYSPPVHMYVYGIFCHICSIFGIVSYGTHTPPVCFGRI